MSGLPVSVASRLLETQLQVAGRRHLTIESDVEVHSIPRFRAQFRQDGGRIPHVSVSVPVSIRHEVGNCRRVVSQCESVSPPVIRTSRAPTRRGERFAIGWRGLPPAIRNPQSVAHRPIPKALDYFFFL